MKILIAADGSDYTKRMLAYLAAHEAWLGRQHEYTVLHAVPELPADAAAYLPGENLQRCYRDAADAVLNPIRAFFRQVGLQAAFIDTVAAPADAIASTASTAQCATPVLIVR